MLEGLWISSSYEPLICKNSYLNQCTTGHISLSNSLNKLKVAKPTCYLTEKFWWCQIRCSKFWWLQEALDSEPLACKNHSLTCCDIKYTNRSDGVPWSRRSSLPMEWNIKLKLYLPLMGVTLSKSQINIKMEIGMSSLTAVHTFFL